MVSVAMIQLCHCSMKAALDNMETNGHNCSNKTLLKKLSLAQGLLFANSLKKDKVVNRSFSTCSKCNHTDVTWGSRGRKNTFCLRNFLKKSCGCLWESHSLYLSFFNGILILQGSQNDCEDLCT